MRTRFTKTGLSFWVLVGVISTAAAVASTAKETTPGVPTSKPAAAKEKEEQRFLAAARKAFEKHDGSELAKLTCWDRVPEKMKKNTQRGYDGVVLEEKDVTYDVELVEPDLKFIDKDHTDDGVVHRSNLPVTRQLNVKFRDKDKKLLCIFCLPVGQKEGKLVLTALAPVK